MTVRGKSSMIMDISWKNLPKQGKSWMSLGCQLNPEKQARDYLSVIHMYPNIYIQIYPGKY